MPSCRAIRTLSKMSLNLYKFYHFIIRTTLINIKFTVTKWLNYAKKARQQFYDDKISHTRDTNPKMWWDSIKMLSGSSSSPPITSIAASSIILKDVYLAESINESFSHVGDALPPLIFIPIPFPDVPDEYIITPEAVEHAILAIQKRKSVGPDEIPNWLLKTSATTISNHVCPIYNSSISEGYVPTLWKSADVLPLRKIPQPKSIKSDLDQYPRHLC